MNGKEWLKQQLPNTARTVRIGVIAKYVDNADTYMSLFEAVKSAAWANEVGVEIVWVNAENLEKDKKAREQLKTLRWNYWYARLWFAWN
jgi:CTP synthase (UTP-ammonia lyase)